MAGYNSKCVFRVVWTLLCVLFSLFNICECDKFFPYGASVQDNSLKISPGDCFYMTAPSPIYTSRQSNTEIMVCPEDNIIRGKDFNAHVLGHSHSPNATGTFSYRNTAHDRQVQGAVKRHAYDPKFSASWTLYATWSNVTQSDLFEPQESMNRYQIVMSADFNLNVTYIFYIYGDNLKVESSVPGVSFNNMSQQFLLPDVEHAGIYNKTMRNSNVNVPGMYLFRLGKQGWSDRFIQRQDPGSPTKQFPLAFIICLTIALVLALIYHVLVVVL